MSSPKFKRRNYLINAKFQIHFVFLMIFLSAIAIGIFYAVEMYYLKGFFVDKKNLCEDSKLFWYTSSNIKHSLDLIFIIKSVILTVLLLVAGILYSHRVAGPIYRMRCHMKAMMEGKENMPQLGFRENDFFPELADDFNRLMDKLKKG